MASFLTQFADKINSTDKQQQSTNITLAGPLANVFSQALNDAYSTEIEIEEDEDTKDKNIIEDGFANKESRIVGESQQTSSIEQVKLLEDITNEDIEKLNKSSEHTTIYTIARSQLNETKVQELCKRIQNFSGKTYDRSIDKYYSPFYLVLVDDQGMPSWFNAAVGTVDVDSKKAMMLNIEHSAKEANIPVYNTFGAALKDYGKGL